MYRMVVQCAAESKAIFVILDHKIAIYMHSENIDQSRRLLVFVLLRQTNHILWARPWKLQPLQL